MTDQDISIRTTALHYANQSGVAPNDTILIANKFYDFLKGKEPKDKVPDRNE